MDRDWAIIVGVKDYWDKGLNTLEGPVSDARSFHDWLLRSSGGDIADASRIKFVQSVGPPKSIEEAKPTGDNVFAAGEHIRDWLETRHEQGRRLYIYMSGHGCTPMSAEQAESVALVMANAQTSRILTNFPATACAKYMRRGGYFEEVILIMDCCRSKSNVVAFPYYVSMADTTRGGVLVEAYATGFDSQAHEFPYPPDNKMKGAFTRALVTCLQSGRLTGHQLKESVEFLMEKDLLSKGFNKKQVAERQPIIRSDPDRYLNQIIFSEGAQPARTEIRIRREPDMPAPQIVRTAVWPATAVHKKDGDDPDPFCWLLEPGRYGLTIGNTTTEFSVYVGSPEEIAP